MKNNFIFLKKKMSDVHLLEHQVEWSRKALSILHDYFGYIDVSKMGSGKTRIALWLAKKLELQLFVVCPVTIIPMWEALAQEFDIPIVLVISYQSLRGTKNQQPKHGFLIRHDVRLDSGIRQVSFETTEDYHELLNEGTLVVFDEIHNIKNNSTQYKACKALIHSMT